MSEGQLEGRIALVTGASSGIGRAVALGFAAEGAHVILAARRQQELDSAVSEIKAAGGSAEAAVVDVTDEASVASMMAGIEKRHGGLDVVLCNAGGNTASGRVDEVASADWLACVNLNLLSGYYTARAALPLLRARGGGRIIMTGSGMGHRGQAGFSAYCVGKAALWMLVRTLAEEVVTENISVNELVPGPVITPATERERLAAGRPAFFTTPGEWQKQPEDIVPLALFMAAGPNPGPTAQSFNFMRRQG